VIPFSAVLACDGDDVVDVYDAAWRSYVGCGDPFGVRGAGGDGPVGSSCHDNVEDVDLHAAAGFSNEVDLAQWRSFHPIVAVPCQREVSPDFRRERSGAVHASATEDLLPRQVSGRIA